MQWLTESLTRNVSPTTELAAKQQFETVAFALSSDELELILTKAFSFGRMLPGCVEGGYFDVIDESTLLYGWEEQISCHGGVTDRYGDSSIL